jgi:hypothetical protein
MANQVRLGISTLALLRAIRAPADPDVDPIIQEVGADSQPTVASGHVRFRLTM